jgi:ABC-2 type transport system ATP-binding protein
MPIVRVENLIKQYNSFVAVKGIDIEVKRGESFGFLGPNGAGKTTTINVLCTLLKATSGTAQVNGFDCLTQPHKVRSSIGLVFQEVTLDNELTAYENLIFHCYLYNMKRSDAEERIGEILEVVDLSNRKDEQVKKYSGGMKRRLELARGLLHRPKVLFLDEPTLGLDPQSRVQTWDFIEKLKVQEDITIFMTTHYLEEAENCDRIAIIDEGKIIACGTSEELKKNLEGDTISLKTRDDEKARSWIEEKFKISVSQLKDGLSFTVSGGENFIPQLFNGFPIEVLSVSLKRPSLDDVFISLTGKEIKDNGAGTNNSRMNRRSR